jgi:hypothetical protein
MSARPPAYEAYGHKSALGPGVAVLPASQRGSALSAVDTSIVVALIASITSVIVASSTALWTVWQTRQQSQSQEELETLKAELQKELEEREAAVGAKAELDRYREPLLFAANELGHRLDNIRNGEFLSYLGRQDGRQVTALYSTLFRFGQYFAQLELLYANISLLHFERDEDTKTVAGLLRDIGRRFTWDYIDVTGPGMRPRFMMWREELRAIGEMMCERRDGKPVSSIGYASFVNDYENRYASWFRTFGEDLHSFAEDQARGSANGDDSERLRLLQGLLAKLVKELDEEHAYLQWTDGRPTPLDWMASGDKPSRRAELRKNERGQT